MVYNERDNLVTLGPLFLIMLSTLCFRLLSEETVRNFPRLNAESASEHDRPYLGFVSGEASITPHLPKRFFALSQWYRFKCAYVVRLARGTCVSSCVSVRYLKNVRICACGDHSTWTRPQRNAELDICESRVFFSFLFFCYLQKRVAG